MKSNVSIIAKADCCGCSSCYNRCPADAVSMKPDAEGFLYPYIDESICIDCGLCLKGCPAHSKPVLNHEQIAYAAYAKDTKEHKTSSSGGIFAVLARYFLGNNGYICGAAFDDIVHLKHIVSDSESDLMRIKETKYVQSEIGTVYKTIRELLEQNHSVLFCGTPCQAAGLNAFLGKEYDNLLIIDLICHGVPSPQVFRQYLEEIGNGSTVKRMTFRDKSEGMGHVYLRYYLENGDIVSETYGESKYIKGFLQNLTVRPSCFQCKYKGVDRSSDITIGDFWGLNDYHPEMISEFGTSAVLVHSKKGSKFIDAVKDQLVYKEAKPEEVAFWNTCLKESVSPCQNRSAFFDEYKSLGVHHATDKYYIEPVKTVHKPSMLSKVKRKVKTGLNKIGIKR